MVFISHLDIDFIIEYTILWFEIRFFSVRITFPRYVVSERTFLFFLPRWIRVAEYSHCAAFTTIRSTWGFFFLFWLRNRCWKFVRFSGTYYFSFARIIARTHHADVLYWQGAHCVYYCHCYGSRLRGRNNISIFSSFSPSRIFSLYPSSFVRAWFRRRRRGLCAIRSRA